MSSASTPRRPWPMKWIVVAILAMIVPYTIITFVYRKPGPAFQPYEDMKNRANVKRLLDAGYQRLPIVAQRPADSALPKGGASIATAPGGLPEELRTTLVAPLLLPAEILSVTAAPALAFQQAYPIHLTCTLPAENQQIAGADIYLRGDTVVITPTLEHVGGGLAARSPQTVALLTIPAGVLKPGRYTVTLAGERTSRMWPLDVK
ncbi:MAG: hypothetical protein JNL39_22855 [Opitutaceae bacterium]|nr:hypothetical protein [Opitutaceae bacterium]